MSDDMGKELTTQSVDYPLSGKDGFTRGGRNYFFIRNSDFEKVQIHGDKSELQTLSFENTRTPEAYLGHVASMLRQTQARMRINQAKESESDTQSESATDSFIAFKRLRANLVGFGKAALETEDASLAFQAFNAAGVLTEEFVQQKLEEFFTSPDRDPTQKLKLSRAIIKIQSDRQQRDEKMEDIRGLLPLAREYSNSEI